MADFADIFTGRLLSEIPKSLSALCDALKDKRHLEVLDVSDNAVGHQADTLVPLLTANRNISVFKINNCGLGVVGGKIIADALQKWAETDKAEGKKETSLRVVVCGRNRLENGSAPVWAEAFSQHVGLTEVKMPQNGIREEGIISLTHRLASCSKLEHLDFQDNVILKAGSSALSAHLASWPYLQTLNLSDCLLSNEGAVELVTAIADGSNPALHTLLLQNDDLETGSFEVIASEIGGNLKGLKVLEVQFNEFDEDDEHIQTIADSMKARGDKFYYLDEEEDEEEKGTEGEDEEKVERKEREEDKEEEIDEVLITGEKKATPQEDENKKTADELASLMLKVSIE